MSEGVCDSVTERDRERERDGGRESEREVFRNNVHNGGSWTRLLSFWNVHGSLVFKVNTSNATQKAHTTSCRLAYYRGSAI